MSATGKQILVRDFIRISAENLGLTLRFEGQGINEVAIVEAIEGDKEPFFLVPFTILP